MTLNELFDIWLNKYAKYKLKLRTFITYQNIYKNHIEQIIGHYELNELSTTLIQDFIVNKIEKGNLINNLSLSYNTVNLIISILKQVIKLGYNLSLISYNITNNILIPKRCEKKIDVLNHQEQQLLEAYCLSHKNNYIGIVLCLYTGIRIGELLALTWDDINFDTKLLSINKTVCVLKINGKYLFHIDEPKTKSSIRLIPISKQLLPYLKRIKLSSSSNFVITTRKNTMVSIRSYQMTFTKILAKLKIKYHNFHALRHTFATRSLELGMDIKSLSEILGHKNAMITLNRYSHSMLNYKIEMINKLGKMLNSSKKESLG